ncbi:MAG: EAL domain-containing protein [Pseudomonadota bacterium]|nr:EAL domain-containing protein [Pseudomonadota bacterium]
MATNDVLNQPLRLLVVEDNEDDYLLLQDHLQACGVNMQSQCVDNETDLLKALEQPWDMVISDYSLPGTNGERILQLVRSKDPIVSFIFFSGTISEAAIIAAIKSGAQDYIMKNDLARLLPTLQREQREYVLRKEAFRQQERLNKLSMAITQTADGIVITDREGIIEYVNPAFERMTGHSAEDSIGQPTEQLYSSIDGPQYQADRNQVLHTGQAITRDIISLRKDHSPFHAEKCISPIRGQQGDITHLVSSIRDVTSRVTAERDRQRLANVLESTPDSVIMVDQQGTIVFANKAGQSLLRFDGATHPVGQSIAAVFPEELRVLYQGTILPALQTGGTWRDELWLHPEPDLETSIQTKPVSLVAMLEREPDSGEQIIALIGRDITEKKQFESELLFHSTHDTLTQLPNRPYARELLQNAVDMAERQTSKLAVLSMDLDNFKVINHSLGHSAGDKLLKEIKRRLSSCLRNTDIIARLGSDEFAVISSDVQKAEHVSAILSKIESVLKLPVRIDDTEFFVTASTGIAIYPQDGNTVDELLRKANIAMKTAQSRGQGQYQFYSAEIDAKGREYLELEADLRYAIINDELCLHYQPQIDVTDGHPVGVEALLRWNSPKRGLVSPAEFIPILESTGLINRVGEWVIAQACRQYHQFAEAGHTELRVSVNVSAVQFRDQEFHKKVESILIATGMPPEKLELEITENMLMQDPEGASRTLLTLANMGVRTAIDDFGTGYSSLSYLNTFPLTTLKIDQSFVRELDIDAGSGARDIVEASVALAHKLGMEVVAEGVETATQLKIIADTGCQLVQGYFFSKPLPEETIISYIRSTTSETKVSRNQAG